MDAPQELESIFSVTFCCEFKSLMVSSSSGLRIYQLDDEGKPRLVHEIQDGTLGPIAMAERVSDTSLLIFVTVNQPRTIKLHFTNSQKSAIRHLFSYANHILSIKLNRTRIMVCLKEEIVIHNFRTMELLLRIENTTSDPNWFCALSRQYSDEELSWLAYPSCLHMGDIEMYNMVSLEQSAAPISAHNSNVVALEFNLAGNRLASASEKGTVIRVFSVPDGSLLFELQRGLSRCVAIKSLAFDRFSNFLACVSNKETVHIFKLEPNKDDEDKTLISQFRRRLVLGSLSLLPATVSEVLNRNRAFAVAKLPTSEHNSIVAWSANGANLLVMSTDGTLRMFESKSSEGGEWPLRTKFKLSENSDSSEEEVKVKDD